MDSSNKESQTHWDALLEASVARDTRDHQELLDLALKVALDHDTEEKAIVALWLRDWSYKNEFLLDLCAPKNLASSTLESLTSLIVAAPQHPKSDNYASESVKSLEGCPQLRDVAESIGAGGHVVSFPLIDQRSRERTAIDSPVASGADTHSSYERRLIGFLQLWTSLPLNEHQTGLLKKIAHAAATNLFRQRSRRKLESLEQLQKEVDGLKKWLQTAARVSCEATSAEHCFVFVPAPNRRLKAVAVHSRTRGGHFTPDEFVASENSLIRRIFEQPDKLNIVRLRNFCNEEERTQVYGTAVADLELEGRLNHYLGEPQKAWMAAPITAQDDQVLAVIVLINKKRNLPRQFSVTDEEIVGLICQFLASVLPSILTRSMLEAAARREEVVSLTSLGNTQAVPVEVTEGLTKLFEVLQESVPNVSGATLWLSPPNGETESKVIHLQGDPMLQRHPDLLHTPSSKVQCFPATPPSTPYFVLRVLGLHDTEANFGVTLSSERLSDPERQMLTLFVRVLLSNPLRAREILLMQMRTIIELRHNIRAGLNGLGHLDVAMNIFSYMREHQDKSIPRVMMDKMFKSVRRAHAYAEQTRVLLEESRFMLSDLKRDNLRIKKTSIGSLVRKVMLALSLQAEDYHVTLNLEDKIPRNEYMEVDAELIYILFFNLIDNVVKYSLEHESVKVKLFLADRQWHFEVENQGPRIDERAESQIFLPFVRKFADTMRKARPGTGLGLAIAKHIVQAHEGRIDVKSTPYSHNDNQPILASNTFTVKIPRWKA